MYSKVMAAKQAADTDTISNIAWGREKEVLTRIYQGEYIGTLIHC
jgi:glutamate 5-kinase